MILKAFRENSNQKFINKLLNSKSAAVSAKKIESVGVVVDANEFADVDAFKHFFNSLGIQLPKSPLLFM